MTSGNTKRWHKEIAQAFIELLLLFSFLHPLVTSWSLFYTAAVVIISWSMVLFYFSGEKVGVVRRLDSWCIFRIVHVCFHDSCRWTDVHSLRTAANDVLQSRDHCQECVRTFTSNDPRLQDSRLQWWWVFIVNKTFISSPKPSIPFRLTFPVLQKIAKWMRDLFPALVFSIVLQVLKAWIKRHDESIVNNN